MRALKLSEAHILQQSTVAQQVGKLRFEPRFPKN